MMTPIGTTLRLVRPVTEGEDFKCSFGMKNKKFGIAGIGVAARVWGYGEALV